MLKRYQILMNDWLADFVKERAKGFDISFSETVRMALCVYYTLLLSQDCKECKTGMTMKKNAAATKRWLESPEPLEEMHKAMSRVYFEARKAIECYQKQQKKEKSSMVATG